MKKSLSLMLAIALVFGLFNAMASAEVSASTPADAGSYLQKAGIIKGNASGDLLLNDTWEREDVAVLLSRLLGKEDEAKNTAKSHTYADVRGTFYDGYLSWAREKGYMEGASATKFGFDAKIDNQSFAAVILRALGVDTTGAENYAKVPELAVKAGILPEGTDWKASATRGTTYVVLVTALNTVVGDTGKKLGEILGLPGFEVTVLGVSKIAQSGAKKFTVDFNRALTEAEAKDLKAEVKNGLVPYPVTIKVADDKKSAALEATFLPAGEYEVKVNEFEAVKVTVVDAKVTTIEIGATVLQVDAAQDLKVKALNQFNEEVAGAIGDANITAFSSEKGDLKASPSKLANGKLDLSGEKVDNTVIVTAFHPATGKSATKTFKLVAASSATSIQLGQVAPLKDDTRITANKQGYVLPYTLADQYGSDIKLPSGNSTVNANTAVIGGINFVVSDVTIIDPASFVVDADGVLKFNTLAAGTVVITAVNSKTGANAAVTVKVEAAPSLGTFQISNPGVLVVKGEAVTIPYVAADTYGAPIAKKDVPAAAAAAGVTFNVNGVTVPSNDIKWKANGDLVITFNGAPGAATLFVWKTNSGILSQLPLDINAPAYPVSIVGIKDLKTTMTQNAEQALGFGNLVVRDNYGRTMTSQPVDWDLTFTLDGAASAVDLIAGPKVKGHTANGTQKVNVKLEDDNGVKADVTYAISFTKIANSSVTSVTVGAISTIYGDNFTSALDAVDYAKGLSLTGKTAEGTEVAIVPTDFADNVTSSNSGIVAVDTVSDLTIYGVAKGTATITVWRNGTKLNEQEVTVSDAKPVATTVKFTAEEATTVAGAFNAASKLEVKDQYGVTLSGPLAAGKYYSSNADVATVNITTGAVTQKVTGGVAQRGIVTITFVSNNGLSASILVNVE